LGSLVNSVSKVLSQEGATQTNVLDKDVFVKLSNLLALLIQNDKNLSDTTKKTAMKAIDAGALRLSGNILPYPAKYVFSNSMVSLNVLKVSQN